MSRPGAGRASAPPSPRSPTRCSLLSRWTPRAGPGRFLIEAERASRPLDEPIDHPVQHVQRHAAGGEQCIVEGAQVEAVAQRLLGLVAQRVDMKVADLVAAGLARPGAIAVDF